MRTTETAAKTRTGSEVRDAAHTTLDNFTRTSIRLMGAVSGAIGIWAAATMVVAMMHAGGPLALAGSWFKAVAGL